MSALIVTLTVALLALSANQLGGPAGQSAALDAGPLSGAHAGFTREQGCVACHEAHGPDIGRWIAAAFTDKDLSTGCLECHGFAGPEKAAHNTRFPARDGLPEPACTACHLEHKGVGHRVANVDNTVCQNCHEKRFRDFPKAHPPFPDDFPYELPNSVRFDHGRHLNKHFLKEKHKAEAPSCTGCHEVKMATREVRPKGYDTCQSCHDEEISDPERDLVVFRLPVLEPGLLDRDRLKKVCKAFGTAPPDADPLDELDPLPALLLNVPGDDPDRYGAPLAALLLDMAERGVKALHGLVDAETGSMMFSGLSSALIKKAACAFAQNREFEPSKPTDSSADSTSGWRVDGLSVRYHTVAHDDPVIRQWMTWAGMARARIQTASADAALQDLLSPDEGAGACGKCHAGGIGRGIDPQGSVQWTYRAAPPRPYTRYAHAPHINLLGPDVGCVTCHKMNDQADYSAYFKNMDQTEFVSNFHAIRKETCTECHTYGLVSIDCQLCHQYHNEPRFKISFQQKRRANEGRQPPAVQTEND